MLLGTKEGSTITVFIEPNVEQEVAVTVRSYPAVTTSTWKQRSTTIPGSTPQSLGDDIYRLAVRATPSGEEEIYTVTIANAQYTSAFTVLVKPESNIS